MGPRPMNVGRAISGSLIAILGVLIVAVGAYLILHYNRDHTICSSGFASAFFSSQCSTINLRWTVGWVLGGFGLLLIVVGIVVTALAQNGGQRPIQAAPPGWYAHPNKPGWFLWFDGQRYTVERPPDVPPSTASRS